MPYAVSSGWRAFFAFDIGALSAKIPAMVDSRQRANWFIATFLASIIGGMLAAVGLGLLVDPNARIFGRDRIAASIVSELGRGHRVLFDQQIDDRYLQRVSVSQLAARPDVVVTGSSRSRNMGQGLFPGRMMRNNSVNSAVIEDHIAVYGLYAARGMLPYTAVIDVDPWLFNARFNSGLWPSLQAEVDYAKALMAGGTPPPPKAESRFRWPSHDEIRQLFSYSHIRASIMSILNTRRLGVGITVVPDSDPGFVYRPDGSHRWHTDYEHKTAAEVAEKVSGEGGGDAFKQLSGFDEISRDRQALFESFITWLQRSGVRVVLLMLPYQPLAYADFTRNGLRRPLDEVEAYALRLASDRVTVIGSYDPAKVGCAANEFVDGHHPLESCSRKVLDLSHSAAMQTARSRSSGAPPPPRREYP